MKTRCLKNSIVTEITPFKNFYVAEDYHKNYYEQHQDAPYCNFVIDPKIHKLLQKYGNEIKEEYNSLSKDIDHNNKNEEKELK